MEKTCSKCGFIGQDGLFKKGRGRICKPCQNKYQREFNNNPKRKELNKKKRQTLERVKYMEEYMKNYIPSEKAKENRRLRDKKRNQTHEYKLKRKTYRSNPIQKIKTTEYNKKYRAKNIENILQKENKFREHNRENINKSRQIRRDTLNDAYIVSLIVKRTSLSAPDIKKYTELIEAKRAQLQIKRLTKK